MGRVAIANAVKAEIGKKSGGQPGNTNAQKRGGQLTTSFLDMPARTKTHSDAHKARAIAAEKARGNFAKLRSFNPRRRQGYSARFRTASSTACWLTGSSTKTVLVPPAAVA